jgi:SAM-dependent MidA family methyltransferase
VTDEAVGQPRLVELMRDEILASMPPRITFARFMERALAEPGLGYYATSDERPTRGGDFLTAPELHPLFGRCLGRQLHELWERLGSPARFTVQEWGAGRGTLRRTVREGLEADGSGLVEAIDWEAVDLHGGTPATVPAARVTGAIVANEFLDALPVHRMVQRAGELRERYVTWNGRGFAEIEGEPSTPDLAGHLAAAGVSIADGQGAEICLEATAWVGRAAAGLERGALVVLDYGYEAPELYGPRHLAGTLVTYRNHRVGTDPYSAVGYQDITAHVDLTALDRAAVGAGLERLGSTTQARFLAALGLGELLSDLGRDPSTDPQEYLDARAAVGRMLDPRHLGAFRVLAYGRGAAGDLPLRGLASPAGSTRT